jgi:primosomal protein N' (replication factor Y)
MIDADSLLSFPDFRSDERLFHILMRAVRQTGISREKNRPGKVIIQTFHPESTFFQRETALDSEAFSKQILTEREDLYYPPFSRLLAFICQGKQKKSNASAQALRLSLEKLLPKKDSRYRLSAPQPAKKKLSRKAFESTLLLRIPEELPLAENIGIFLRKNSASYIIDVDPLSFS